MHEELEQEEPRLPASLSPQREHHPHSHLSSSMQRRGKCRVEIIFGTWKFGQIFLFLRFPDSGTMVL